MTSSSSDFHSKVRALFHELADLDESDQRARLDTVSAEPEVVAEVRELLSRVVRDRENPFDETRLGAWNAAILERADREQADELIGQGVDGYLIRGVLGVGGMGTVYVAEQRGEIERIVALKLIKLGMDSRKIVSRFEAERQALALMNHEGIARVYHCGTTSRGQPYFVMEYVEGAPIDRFCEEHSVSLEARLDLIRQVCEAVHHAHQKGVVHRDLKPGNVLVSRENDRLRAKVIDFGLAKAMGSELVEATLFTEVGQIVGTPEFMAPEQADPTNADVDTRADVYSIGVLLFRLLVGELPFSANELRREFAQAGGGVHARRETPRPSSRIASRRGESRSSLRRALRSDLDWIVLKAMDPDRNRRYDSATALADDLRRFAAHEPLVAGPPSASYRVQKIMRRYRAQILVAGIVLLALAVGGAVAVHQWLRARQTAEEFEQLAGVVKQEVAVAEEQTLHPAWPAQLDALRAWVADRWEPLAAIRRRLRRSIDGLRERALPWSDEDRLPDAARHPRSEELARLRREIATLRHAQAIRLGEAEFEPAEVPDQQPGRFGSSRMYALAWTRIGPLDEDRTVWGEEAEGLAFAQRLMQRYRDGQGGVSECTAWKALAFGFLANGLDEKAIHAAERAVATAQGTEQHRRSHREQLAQIRSAATTTPTELDRRLAAARLLASEVEKRRSWRFTEESAQFLHDALADLHDRIDQLETTQLARVRRRIRWAESLPELTARHPQAEWSWDDVRRTVREDARYARASKIKLREVDVYGLVPLGPNPVTGYLEFYHLRSAWDGESDPRAIPLPEHDVDGRIPVGADTGIVFVLLPGAQFVMGAQATDPTGSDYDPNAKPAEAAHDLEVGPFFLARHELTKGQWSRLAVGSDVDRLPSRDVPGETRGGDRVLTSADPVEQVSWLECRTLAEWHGLALPTEVQWEYGCRGGTPGPNAWPAARMAEFANVADQSSVGRTQWDPHDGDDGHFLYSPAGVFLPNAFGMHDMIGNVSEWCLDLNSEYGRPIRAADGLRIIPPSVVLAEHAIIRGGSYRSGRVEARSAWRGVQLKHTESQLTGVRFARSVEPTQSLEDSPAQWVRLR